jgi:hypothetical protein
MQARPLAGWSLTLEGTSSWPAAPTHPLHFARCQPKAPPACPLRLLTCRSLRAFARSCGWRRRGWRAPPGCRRARATLTPKGRSSGRRALRLNTRGEGRAAIAPGRACVRRARSRAARHHARMQAQACAGVCCPPPKIPLPWLLGHCHHYPCTPAAASKKTHAAGEPQLQGRGPLAHRVGVERAVKVGQPPEHPVRRRGPGSLPAAAAARAAAAGAGALHSASQPRPPHGSMLRARGIREARFLLSICVAPLSLTLSPSLSHCVINATRCLRLSQRHATTITSAAYRC